MPSWLPWLVRNRLTGEQLFLLCCAFPFAALLQLGVLDEAVMHVSVVHQQACTNEQDWVEGSSRVSSGFCIVWHRQAALEALQTALEAFSREDHFESVAGPLLATPLQHTQAATSTSGQVSPICCVFGKSSATF